MAASAMTPKLLDRISNEEYQEKDKWKIDDIALGPKNELLISGHNLEIPKTFISIYKEDSGKYGNRPEFNRNFRQPQPGEQLALFLEGSSIIGLKVENALRLFTIEDMRVLKTLKWKWSSPACLCFYKGKLYAASSSSTTVRVCYLDSEEKNDIFLSDMRSDCVLEMVVVMEKIYVCTKVAGRALVFSMTGLKKMEFENAFQSHAMATSICIHERTELVFVLWNNIQIQLYSQKTSQYLRALDMAEKLHKIRVTTENLLVTLSASTYVVSVYDVGEAINFGESQNTILSSVKKKDQKNLISHDVENLDIHPAEFETFSFPRKSASKQSKVEKLRDRKELDMKQLEENENLQRQFDREVQKVVTNLTEVEEMNTKLEKEVKQLKRRLLAEENKAKEVQTTFVKLNERIRELECTKTKLESQQKKLKENFDQEKEIAIRNEKLHVQVLIHLKRVEERNKTLEEGVAKLKKNLSNEERKAEELQTSSLKADAKFEKLQHEKKQLEKEKDSLQRQQQQLRNEIKKEKHLSENNKQDITRLHEKIRELECKKTEHESQQKLLKDNLDQDKRNAMSELGARVKADTEIEKLQHEKKQLDKEKDSLQRQQQQLRNEIKKEKHLSEVNKQDITRATTTCEKLQEASEVLQREKEDLSEQLSTEKINKEIQIASFSKMTSHASPGSEKMAQRKDEDSYLCDETQSVITESTDSGRGSMHSGLEYHDPFILNGRQLKTELKVAVTVTYRGANMHIPDTGVALDIPAGAVGGKVLIEMIILPFDKLDAPVSTFSCNSSVAVELLPNRMEFHRPVRLILPHCLKLTKNYKKTKNQVQVYVSHHETGPPIWEEVSNAEYVLNETNCVIFVKSFCWVKYEVNNKIVEAKRIRAYTAGKRLKYTEDSLAEIEVGYHWDLPNARENLSISDNMFVYQSKPFIYVKDGNLPLEIFLTKSVPKQWKYITPTENPKVISFKCVADSTEKSCPFVIEKSEPTDRMPFCMFRVQQGKEDLELYIRFDD